MGQQKTNEMEVKQGDKEEGKILGKEGRRRKKIRTILGEKYKT